MATLTAKPRSKSQKNQQKKLTPFEKKWQTIEKQLQKNTTLQQQIAELFERFETDVLPVEQRYIESKVKQINHFISFIGRKTLAEYQRGMLVDMITKMIDDLDTNPFCGDDLVFELKKKITEAYNTFYGIDEDEDEDDFLENIDFSNNIFVKLDKTEDLAEASEMIHEAFDGEKTFSDEQIKAFLADYGSLEEALDAHFTEQFADTDDEYDEELDEEFFKQFRHESAQQEPDKSHLKRLFDSSELNKIYKMLANKLHPDKESDPQVKAEKSHLMGLLSKAKKQKDAFTLLQMLQTYLPEKAAEFDPNLCEAIIAMLNEKQKELEREYQRIPLDSGLAGMVWHKFGAKTKKSQDKNINDYLNYISMEINDNTEVAKQTSTVKQMKKFLQQLNDEMYFYDQDLLEIGPQNLADLEDLFNIRF